MMWGIEWYWGMGMMAVFWGATAAVVYLAVQRPRDAHRPTPRELLDERLATGQLTEEEYARKRGILEDAASSTDG